MAAAVPHLPAPLSKLASYIVGHPHEPVAKVIAPYRELEVRLRQLYAQEPHHELLKDPHVNVLPLFTEDTPGLRVQARDLASESEVEKSRYIMPLPDYVRRPDGSPATAKSLAEFRRNFNVFSESSLTELDWSNVVAAGSSVVNCLLPVPEEYAASKRTLREYYHEKLSPASDVDLFLYGLTEEEAIEKIGKIESQIRDSLLGETTTVRTKHAVTICSQHPVRHVQIVLRIYQSVSEILTGFDIDCSGAAFDGKQVYCSPRALQSYLTQINNIDLSRRSPSYENRLSKYAHRGFEVYWGELDRTRIDPTIFERSFQRTQGLARLLVLERLPTSSARDSYQRQRRGERGRPALGYYNHRPNVLPGNIKDEHEDEVAEWAVEDEFSNYNTFTIPYGPKYHPKRIEKLCYTRDLLLNAEWNPHDDREVYLHRHPAFFGRFEDVAGDCCGFCPTPKTDEEKEIAEEDSQTYISGRISFLKDDPGRQEIGSFNPLTEDDWTDMAYVADTTLLSQAIVDGDLQRVQTWFSQEDVDPNVRDYTGRTPLHLAVTCSTPDVVRCIVDAGARLIARLADGRTALHLAAQRGDTDIVKILMDKSVANEAEEDEKLERKRKADALRRRKDGQETSQSQSQSQNSAGTGDEGSDDAEMLDEGESNVGAFSATTGSFVKLDKAVEAPSNTEDVIPDEEEDDPDFYDINVLAWDTPCSALHFAILSGHEHVVKLLCQEYGADAILPIKLSNFGDPDSILTLCLALGLPLKKAEQMARTLLGLGATLAQADALGMTAFHRYVLYNSEPFLQTLWDCDAAGAKSSLQSLIFAGYPLRAEGPLHSAIRNANPGVVHKLLDAGAAAQIHFPMWLRNAQQLVSDHLSTFERNMNLYRDTEQPLQMAIGCLDPSIALELIRRGADVNAMDAAAYSTLGSNKPSDAGQTVLDQLHQILNELREYKGETYRVSKPRLPGNLAQYLEQFAPGSYQHFVVSAGIAAERRRYDENLREYQEEKSQREGERGLVQKRQAIGQAIEALESVEKALLAEGAKTFQQLYPDLRKEDQPTPKTKDEDVDDYKFYFVFHKALDVTEPRLAAYIDLFEAAWKGDLEKIKTLTLTSWDTEGEEAPLKIAVEDGSRHNLFSIALLRGHHKVAKAILDIVQAQYTPEEQEKARYRMRREDDSDQESSVDSDVELSDSDANSEPELHREVLDHQFTMENVGQARMKVDSHTKPLEVINWHCSRLDDESYHGLPSPAMDVFQHCVETNDLETLSFALDLANHYRSQEPDQHDEGGRSHDFYDSAFRSAVEKGRTALLPELIKKTGAGLPLEQLVQGTGTELKEKPRYYQGLTVYGKKRKDWAQNQRSFGFHSIQTSPLILAAVAGCIESVEWFLSDTPLRHYSDFSTSKMASGDPRIKHIAQSPGGFEAAVLKWLNHQKDLVIHATILNHPCDETVRLITYLIKSFPDLVEAKDNSRETPLFLAAYLGRTEFAKLLIDAGADQTCRDRQSNNLLHAAVTRYPLAEDLATFLDLLDQNLLRQMSAERNSLSHGGRTPLHAFLFDLAAAPGQSLRRYETGQQAVDVVRLLIARFGVGQLDVLDGTGNSALHVLLTSQVDAYVVHAVLDAVTETDGPGAAAALLARENVVGQTPLEVARDQHVARQVRPLERHRIIPYRRDSDRNIQSLLGCSPASFVTKDGGVATPAAAVAAEARGWEMETAASDGEDSGGGAGPELDPWIRDEDSNAAACLWRVCAEFAFRVEGGGGGSGGNGGTGAAATALVGGKRRLASLHEANDVARRLGEKHTGSRYGFGKRKGGESAKEPDIVDLHRRYPPHVPWGRTFARQYDMVPLDD